MVKNNYILYIKLIIIVFTFFIQAVFVAPRPRQNTQKRSSQHRRRSSQKLKNQNSVKLKNQNSVKLKNQNSVNLKQQNSVKLKRQNSVKILSIESFSNGTVRRQKSMDNNVECGNGNSVHRMPNLQRLLSIPEILLNATASASASGLPCSSPYQKNHTSQYPKLAKSSQISLESAVKAPRSRIVNMFANREQVRPVYAPKHPIDLEGLQETAV